MTAWIIAKLWPLIAVICAIPLIYWRGKHNGKVEAHRDTLEAFAKRTKQRQEIEDAIDQDADLVRRAAAAGVVRPDSK